MRWDWDLNLTRNASRCSLLQIHSGPIQTLTEASTRYAVLAGLFASECGGTGI